MEVNMTGIRKSFGSNSVLRGVDFDIHAGEVHALMGENGAGKSTLMNILTGLHKSDAGEISINGEKKYFNYERGKPILENEIKNHEIEKQVLEDADEILNLKAKLYVNIEDFDLTVADKAATKTVGAFAEFYPAVLEVTTSIKEKMDQIKLLNSVREIVDKYLVGVIKSDQNGGDEDDY